MEFIKNTIKTPNGDIVYWETQNNADNIVLLLASGASTGEVFTNLDLSRYKNIRFIAPNFPGRGKSRYKTESLSALEDCAELVTNLLKNLEIQEVTVVAVSFGTMVVDFILNTNSEIKIKNCILIAPGEYFNRIQRILLKIIFFPTRLAIFRKMYFHLLRNSLPALKKVDLVTIREQWLDTLNYKIDPDKDYKEVKMIYLCSKDKIINKESKNKVAKKYPNSQISYLDFPHPISNEVITTVVDKAINDLDY